MTTLLNQPHQLPNIAAPLIQHLISRLGLDEGDDPRRSVDFGKDGFRRYETGEEEFGFGDGKGEERGETGEGDARVVACYDADVLRISTKKNSRISRHSSSDEEETGKARETSPTHVLDDPVVQDLPPLLPLRMLLLLLDVSLNALDVRRSTKDLRPPERVAVQFLDVRPPPQFGVDEALDEVAVPSIGGQRKKERKRGKRKNAQRLLHLLQLVVLINAVQQIRLLVVVRSEYEEVDDVAEDGGGGGGVLRDGRGGVDGTVVLRDVEVFVGRESVEDHEGVVTEFEVLRSRDPVGKRQFRRLKKARKRRRRKGEFDAPHVPSLPATSS